MKIQLVRQENGKYEIIRNCNHSEDVIIQRTRVKILDDLKKVDAMYVLEGLGQLSWIPIESTGNHEVFVQIFIGPQILDAAEMDWNNTASGNMNYDEFVGRI